MSHNRKLAAAGMRFVLHFHTSELCASRTCTCTCGFRLSAPFDFHTVTIKLSKVHACMSIFHTDLSLLSPRVCCALQLDLVLFNKLLVCGLFVHASYCTNLRSGV
jgi:hypothetical protein